MRISDWSSDVCSSDLLMFEQVQQQPVDSFAHHTVDTHQVDAAREVFFPQDLAECHQPLVDLSLVMHQLGKSQGLGEVLYLAVTVAFQGGEVIRSEEHTSELQSLMRISYAVFCLKKKKNKI